MFHLVLGWFLLRFQSFCVKFCLSRGFPASYLFSFIRILCQLGC